MHNFLLENPKMIGRGDLLLAAIAISVFSSHVTPGMGKLLEASSDVFDDMYEGCREEAKKRFIQSGLIKEEIENSPGLKKAWVPVKECAPFSEGSPEHMSALSVLTHGDTVFLQELSTALDQLGVNVSTYEQDFHFKSLHFLLMDSMMMLKQNVCTTVHKFKDKQDKTPTKNSLMRFSSFSLASSDLHAIGDLADETIFTINTCSYINLGKHLCNKDMDAFLLSPAEYFIVDKISKKHDNDGEEYTEMVLKHSGLKSAHNCYIFPRSAAVWISPFAALVTALILFSLNL